MKFEFVVGIVCMGCGSERTDRRVGQQKPLFVDTTERKYPDDDIPEEKYELPDIGERPSLVDQGPTNSTQSGSHVNERKTKPKNRVRQRPALDIERAILIEIQPLLVVNPHWTPPKIPTSAAMELGVRIAKSVVPIYASFTGIEEARVMPQWIGVIGDGIPTADSWTLFVDDVRRSTVDYLLYPSCLGTRFVEASKLSQRLAESYVNARLVEETIVRLLASPPPEGTCMTDTYAQVMSVLSQAEPNKDMSELLNEFYDFYSIVTVVGGLSSTENTLATNSRDRFRAIARAIMTDPSKLRTYKAQLRVNTSRLVKLVEDYLAKTTVA